MSILLPPPSIDAASAPPHASTERSAWRQLLLGAETDAPWVRPALLGLLGMTAVLYLWGLGASGWANSFYSAAVQAGTKSWKAFFFGSSDSSNFITVDKPPASLWVMDISARIFGVNSWSILVPQALEGVAAVGFLYAAVRRWFSPAAGLLAGAVLAVTPVAALMFRFNNPDALLVLLLTIGAYAVVRALERASTKWLVLASALVGFGFITKMLQALLVVPAFGLVYLIAAPTTLRRRLWQLLLAAVALVASAGWWVAAVQLTPAADRPYIGGSQNNSLLNLIFGYNGFGRLTGNESGSVGGGGGQGGGRWGATGWTRLFGSEFGGQISWLLPAALILLVAGLAVTWRARRTDRVRASYVLWGGWLFVTGAVFSLGQGIIHPYYSVALAPAIGALVGTGATMWWARRRSIVARVVLAATVVATAIWSYTLLQRTPNWNTWLQPLVLGGGLAAATAILLLPLRHRLGTAVAAAALVVALAGPTAYTVTTVRTVHDGAIPAAGPAGASTMGFGPGGGPGGGRGNFAGPPANAGAVGRFGGTGGANGGAGGPGGAGGAGNLLNGSSPSAELTATLDQDAGSYTWVAATVGANQASGYQLATGDAVMAIGGFNGTDPAPSLAQFEQYVAEGRIHYFIAGGGFGGGPGAGGSSSSSEIASWVASHFSSTTVGGTTLYDLTSPSSGS